MNGYQNIFLFKFENRENDIVLFNLMIQSNSAIPSNNPIPLSPPYSPC